MSIEPIIYANKSKDIFIVDIPISIAVAQGNTRSLDMKSPRLASCSPLAEPYISTEPKSASAAVRVSNHAGDKFVHETYAELIRNALEQLKRDHGSEHFCHDRVLLSPRLAKSPRKRSADEAFSQHAPVNKPSVARPTESELSVLLDLMAGSGAVIYFNPGLQLPNTSEDSSAAMAFIVIDSDLPESQISAGREGFAITNDTEQLHTLKLTVKSSQGPHSSVNEDSLSYSFHVPPMSGCFLGDCKEVNEFRATARIFAESTRGRFDFVLLDPPWPNKSAKRKSSYPISRNLQDLKRVLLAMDVDTNILPGGFVAVWVTNKAACRSLLLDLGGLFEAWNVTLVEEWIWVKVTSLGKPVAAVEGRWRKPYEVLLVAQAPQSRYDIAGSAGEVKRRVILGVPDLHSRKPCLKPLVEEILLKRSADYQALEIFARHLVAGWLSVGTEVLKYNWDGYWANPADEQDNTESS